MSERVREFVMHPQKAVQWIGNDGGHKVGRVLDFLYMTDGHRYIVLESHTGEIKAVLPELVTPYPSSPIEEPTK